MQKAGFQEPPCMMPSTFGVEDLAVPKRIPLQDSGEPFGQRMARLRQAAGFTQRELATEIGISQRMVAYYEGETDYPPAHLLPAIASAVGVSTDELLGVHPVKQQRKLGRERLWRRLHQLEKLPPKERKQVLAVIDAFLGRHRVAHVS